MVHDLLSNFPSIISRDRSGVFRKYVEAHNEEFQTFDDNIGSVQESLQVDNATGDDLDRIGELFGDVGQRLGRTDDEYRKYLKSVVEAFSGRGTDPAMRGAFGTFLDIDDSEITITEDTTNVEYDLVFSTWTEHSLSSIYQIAEIVDPSGVAINDVQYQTEADTQLSSDAVTRSTSATQQNWDTSQWNTMGWAEADSAAGYSFSYGDEYGI